MTASGSSGAERPASDGGDAGMDEGDLDHENGLDRGGGSGGTTERQSGRGPTSADAAARRFLTACAEVLNGHRPVAHLRAVTAPAAIRSVADQLVRRTTRTYLARPGPSTPVRCQVRLLGVQICEPRDGVAELAATLECGPQTWAVAARLERRADTWLCTLLHVI